VLRLYVECLSQEKNTAEGDSPADAKKRIRRGRCRATRFSSAGAGDCAPRAISSPIQGSPPKCLPPAAWFPAGLTTPLT
jgi:hypothetical protein